MREVAAYDYDAALRVARWPLHEVLIAFLAVVRDEAREAFRCKAQRWATLAPYLERKSREPTPSRMAHVNPNAVRRRMP